jgi:type IV pilus assembly protein PilV
MKPLNQQSGVMLLEALIGLLIFSIGVLALVGMQAAAIRNSTQAKYRTDASFAVNRVLANMQANSANLQDYAGSVTAAEGNWLGTDLPNASGRVVVSDTNLVTITVNWRPAHNAPESSFVTQTRVYSRD